MTTPTRTEIEQYARELWHRDRARSGDPSFDINPELGELSENGYLSVARSELMRDTARNVSEEWKGYNENLEAVVDFQFDRAEAMRTTTFVSGSRGVGKSDVCMRIAEQLQNEGITIISFDPSMDWLKRSSIQQYFTVKPYFDCPIPDTSTIFDISRLTPNQAQQHVEQFSKKLFEFQLDNSAKRFYLIFEEAQIYFPLNSLRSLRRQNSMRVLTVGRNVNVSMCAISQFPSLIDKELIKNCGQVWIGYTSEFNTLKYWKGILGKRTEKLKGLQNGEFIYYCRNKIGLTEIEPYDNTTFKTEIPQPSILPEPIKGKEQLSIVPFLKLGMILCFVILFLRGLK